MALGENFNEGVAMPLCLPRVYRLLHFVEVFDDDLPLIVQIYSGFCGLNECEAISTGQIFRLGRTVAQRRVFACDKRGVVFSLPINMSLPMKILSYKSNDAFSTLKQIVTKFPQLKLKVLIGKEKAGGHESEHLLRPHCILTLLYAYEEHFVEANCISNGIIHCFPTYLPLYASVQVQIVYGMRRDTSRTESTDEFSSQPLNEAINKSELKERRKYEEQLTWQNLRRRWEDQITNNSFKGDFWLNKATLMYDHKNGFSHPLLRGTLLESIPQQDGANHTQNNLNTPEILPKKSSLKKRISISLTRNANSRQLRSSEIEISRKTSSVDGEDGLQLVVRNSGIFGSLTRSLKSNSNSNSNNNDVTKHSVEVDLVNPSIQPNRLDDVHGDFRIASHKERVVRRQRSAAPFVRYENDIEKNTSGISALSNNLLNTTDSSLEDNFNNILFVQGNSNFGVYIENTDTTFSFDAGGCDGFQQPNDNASQISKFTHQNTATHNNCFSRTNCDNIIQNKIPKNNSNQKLPNCAINESNYVINSPKTSTNLSKNSSLTRIELRKNIDVLKTGIVKPSKRNVSYSDTDTVFPIERCQSTSKFSIFSSNKHRVQKQRQLHRLNSRYQRSRDDCHDNHALNNREIERIESGFSKTMNRKESISFSHLPDRQSNGASIYPDQEANIRELNICDPPTRNDKHAISLRKSKLSSGSHTQSLETIYQSISTKPSTHNNTELIWTYNEGKILSCPPIYAQI